MSHELHQDLTMHLATFIIYTILVLHIQLGHELNVLLCCLSRLRYALRHRWLARQLLCLAHRG